MNRIKGLLSSALPVLALLSVGTAHDADARDLQGRLGLGYNAQFSNQRELNGGVPAISGKYALTKDLAVEGVVGLATTTPSNSVVGIKFFKNLFYENNLNFYGMLGAGLVTANTHSGVDLLGGFGAEFFIPGLESVGLSFEVGADMTNITGSMIFRTMGASFLDAGMRFYF
ncbi:MAG: hypothetical protein JST04_04605 [Bdellovibrionales bacterium]|nr:hypothetical protein [Bdellovibrionales bacterium]